MSLGLSLLGDTWQAAFASRLLRLLKGLGVRYCLVGGQAVNACVEPVVSLDLALVVAADQPSRVAALRTAFTVERFPHSLNVSSPAPASASRSRPTRGTPPFVDRATIREVLGLHLPVAHVEDLLQGKLWAVMDAGRRPSKRQKDLADIARLLEAYPTLRERVPTEVLAKLL